MTGINFRLLEARDIDCRIQQINDKGLSLLLYKDARVDMDILDETVGAYNWQRRHERENANCIVSIWDHTKGEWISKEDTGTESNTEKEKGLASDSFKRACFNWGIGRELYTAPFIWIPADKCNIKDRKCYDRFTVVEIGYNDHREINRLVIANAKTGDIVYTFGKAAKSAHKASPAPKVSNDTAAGAPAEKPPIPPPFVAVCGECGKTVTDYKQRTAIQIVDYSMLNYGKPLCGACLAKRIKAERAEKEKQNV